MIRILKDWQVSEKETDDPVVTLEELSDAHVSVSREGSANEQDSVSKEGDVPLVESDDMDDGQQPSVSIDGEVPLGGSDEIDDEQHSISKETNDDQVRNSNSVDAEDLNIEESPASKESSNQQDSVHNAKEAVQASCIHCDQLSAQKLLLEEKLALSQAAYNDTKINLETSDSKLAESANMIDELKMENERLKAAVSNLEEKDKQIDELNEQITLLKQTGPDNSENTVNRLKFVCQKLEKEKKKVADEFQKKVDDLNQSKIKLEENLTRSTSEKLKLVEKEKALLGLFMSVKGMIDRTNPEIAKTSDNNKKEDVPQSPENVQAKANIDENVLFVCNKCTFQSKSELVFKEHKRVDHDGPEKQTIYICDICEQACNSQAEFKAHNNAQHTNKTVYGCGICDAECKTKEELNIHMKGHRQQQTIHCDYCGAAQKSICELDLHIETHHKQKCEFCVFHSSSFVNLQKHLAFIHQIFSSKETSSHDNQGSGNQVKQDDRRMSPYSDDVRRKNGYCRLWNNSFCRFDFCKFLHEESPFCRYQDRCRNPSTCRFFHQKPQVPQKEFQYKEADFPPFQQQKDQKRQ